MTTIPRMLVAGHQLFSALLMEAQLASGDADWPVVLERLREFEGRIKQHMRVEEDSLFPRLALLHPDIESAIAQCREAHARIRTHTQSALCSANAHEKVKCNQLITQLQDLLSSHCHCEERRVYAMAQNLEEGMVIELAGKLGSGTK